MIIERFKFTSIRDESVERITSHLQEIERASSVERIEMCKVCDLEYLCGGTCRLRNLAINELISNAYSLGIIELENMKRDKIARLWLRYFIS